MLLSVRREGWQVAKPRFDHERNLPGTAPEVLARTLLRPLGSPRALGTFLRLDLGRVGFGRRAVQPSVASVRAEHA